MALKKYHVYETNLYLSFIWWGTWGGHLLLASDVGPARPSRKIAAAVKLFIVGSSQEEIDRWVHNILISG